jgi:hypothetical protein
MRLVSLVVLFLFSSCADFLHGQDQAHPVPPVNAPDAMVRRFEIGGQFTDLTLGGPGQFDVPKFAIGPGFAFNLNRHLALDASYSIMNPPAGYVASGGNSEFVAGVRAEARAKHYGIFAYGRPGVFHTTASHISQIASPPPGQWMVIGWPSSTEFVTNVGGGIEFFAPSRVRTRVELGDLLEYFPCGANCTIKDWTNHLQFSVGMYAAIGKPVAGKPFDTNGGQSHRFFDKTNLLLLGVSLLGQSADDITTQRFHSHGGAESDPLARPFVNRGWGGEIGLGVIENSAQIFIMYGLHKMGHHRIEKLVPLADAFIHGYEGYHNLQNR